MLSKQKNMVEIAQKYIIDILIYVLISIPKLRISNVMSFGKAKIRPLFYPSKTSF